MPALLTAMALLASHSIGPVPDGARITLLQMEVAVADTLPPAARTAAARTFVADTRRIRVCGDAIRLAARYKARKWFTGTITTRTNVPLGILPPLLRADLSSRPVGRATRVFAGPGRLRVLVACTAPVGRRPATAIDRTI